MKILITGANIFIYKIVKNSLLSVYNSNLLIFRNEAISTGEINNNRKLKDRFVYKNLIKANVILDKELESLKEE